MPTINCLRATLFSWAGDLSGLRGCLAVQGWRRFFSDRMNSLLKFVVSTTLKEAEWNNSTLIQENVSEELAGLKQQPGQDILMYGSADLMRTLMQHDLIDEYRIWGPAASNGCGPWTYNGFMIAGFLTR